MFFLSNDYCHEMEKIKNKLISTSTKEIQISYCFWVLEALEFTNFRWPYYFYSNVFKLAWTVGLRPATMTCHINFVQKFHNSRPSPDAFFRILIMCMSSQAFENRVYIKDWARERRGGFKLFISSKIFIWILFTLSLNI